MVEHLGKTEKKILIDESPDPIKVEELQTKDASCDKTVLKEDEEEVTTVEPSEPEVDASSFKRVDINCDECSFTAPSSNNLESHVKQQHRIQELLSCNQCDFDSEDSSELQEHLAKNIHDINIKNRTIEDPEASKCHNVHNKNKSLKEIKLITCDFCDYVHEETKNVERHLESVHGSIKCSRCEYSALDKTIMKKHMMTHTGEVPLPCGVCEFEATKEALLEKHIETKHKQKKELTEKPIYKCMVCEKAFKENILFQFHI